MERPIGFELLEVGNDYEFVIKPNSVSGKLISIGEETLTYEYETGAFFEEITIKGKNKRTLNIKDILEIKKNK